MTTAIRIISFDEEGRYEEDGRLLAPGIAVLADNVASTLYFVNVAAADEPGFYVVTESIADISVLSDWSGTLADIPAETVAFIGWLGKPEALAVAV